ncbi:MAG: integrase, partial [Actinomycetota bacterium]|nr:integrase [Actinomycetota bacterium]
MALSYQAGDRAASLAPTTSPALGLDELVAEARGFLAAAEADSTRRNYATDWRAFIAWCASHGFESLPADPEIVALYLTDFARDHKASTVVRRAVGIAKGHRRAGYHSPTDVESVRLVLAGIRRIKGMAPAQKSPLLTVDVLALVATCSSASLADVRDRALLLVGYMGAFRRSELAGLDVEDLEDRPEGMAVNLRRSKVDQEGLGRRKVLVYGSSPATCPVVALRAWLTRAAVDTGPVFRPVDRHGRLGPGRLSGQAVAAVVKRAALAAGLDPSFFAGHS